MESSIAEFLKRKLACELLPTPGGIRWCRAVMCCVCMCLWAVLCSTVAFRPRAPQQAWSCLLRFLN